MLNLKHFRYDTLRYARRHDIFISHLFLNSIKTERFWNFSFCSKATHLKTNRQINLIPPYNINSSFYRNKVKFPTTPHENVRTKGNSIQSFFHHYHILRFTNNSTSHMQEEIGILWNLERENYNRLILPLKYILI